jgi:hypothetical protein
MFTRSVICFALTLTCGWAAERDATPAVVNPVLRSALRHTLSLDGEWDFATDPNGVGEEQQWFKAETELPNRRTLQVPGCWEAQGVGGPGPSSSVAPERSIRPLRGAYVGRGWYRKEVTLSQNWSGQQLWLKVGGVHAQGWFWVNGTYVASNACYCGAYKYNITDLVQPDRKVVVAAKVRNDVPSRKGLMGWIQRFGGLYRSVELEATPDLFLDDVYVAGDLDRREATANIRVRNLGTAPAAPAHAEVSVKISTLDRTGSTGISPAGSARLAFAVDSKGMTNLSLVVPLEPFRPWSPEEPNLYRADLVLKVNGVATDGWVERFGVRKWEVRGGNFYLNNRKYFIRGFGDDSIYPLTLVSPASREIHLQHLKMARSYGFGYVRHHTHCELPEFYEAADAVGIMIQPELPYYGSTPSAAAPGYFKPQEDLEELYTHYRRYVSLATYCTGNEGLLGSPVDHEVYQLAKRLDPSRLALHQDGGANRKANSDFYQAPSWPWVPGKLDDSMPCDAHEYLNLATDEDPRLAGKYTGAVRPPVTVEDFQAGLARAGLSQAWGFATLDAGNQLQSIFQKRGLEQARLDPVCDGYIYWTIVDVGSPAAQGLFNQFWEPKVSRPEYFRQFNGPIVILAKFGPSERILTTGQSLDVEWWISAFAAQPVSGQRLVWHLRQADKELASGEVAWVEAQAGDVKTIGQSRVPMPALTRPAKLMLTAELSGIELSNSWPVWLFPKSEASRERGKGIGASPKIYAALKERWPGLTEERDHMGKDFDLLLTDRLDRSATQALESGKTVLLLELTGPVPGVQLGWWNIGPQAGTAILAHPAFGDFPHAGYLDELWFRLAGHTLSLTNQALHQVEPLMVGRGSQGYLAHVFQAKVGRGKLLGSGLKLLSSAPEAGYLLAQFVIYARSPEFAPRGTLDPSRGLNLWEPR